MTSLKATVALYFFNISFFPAVLENSEHDNQYMFPDQVSDVEWTAGPNMNWVTS